MLSTDLSGGSWNPNRVVQSDLFPFAVTLVSDKLAVLKASLKVLGLFQIHWWLSVKIDAFDDLISEGKCKCWHFKFHWHCNIENWLHLPVLRLSFEFWCQLSNVEASHCIMSIGNKLITNQVQKRPN